MSRKLHYSLKTLSCAPSVNLRVISRWGRRGDNHLNLAMKPYLSDESKDLVMMKNCSRLAAAVAIVAMTFLFVGEARASALPPEDSVDVDAVLQGEGLSDNVIVFGDAAEFDSIVVLSPQESSFSLQERRSLSGAELVEALAGGGSCTAPAGIQVTCQDGSGYVVRSAAPSSMYLGYSWSVAFFSSSNANVIGRGFAEGKETWRGGGSYQSFSFNVPWYGPVIAGKGQEIMANKVIKVRSMNPPAGVSVNWS